MITKIEKVKKFAEKHLVNDSDSVHNMEHVMRVYNLAVKLAEVEFRTRLNIVLK